MRVFKFCRYCLQNLFHDAILLWGKKCHCILRAIPWEFWDEVFSLKIWGHFIQQCNHLSFLRYSPSITDGVHRNENLVEIIPVFSTFSNIFKKKNIYIYRISANSFRGNYSFLNLALCTVTFDLYFINLNSCRGNYSREETIQGRKLFAEIRYIKLKTKTQK